MAEVRSAFEKRKRNYENDGEQIRKNAMNAKKA